MVRLIAFYGFNSLSDTEKHKICNGAGAANDWRSKFIPNTLYGLDCTLVFNIHDYAYHMGRTLEDKELADTQMFSNLIEIIKCGNFFLGFFRRRRAMKYYEAVSMYGHDAFWAGKDDKYSIGYQEGGRSFDIVEIHCCDY